MAGEAFQVICATQGSHKLAGETFAALATDLAAALWLRGLQLLLVLEGVGHGAHRAVGAVLRGEALRPGRGVGVEGLGGLSREAIAARIIGVVLRRTLSFHRGRRRRVHGRQRLTGGGRWRWAGGAGRGRRQLGSRAVKRAGAGAGGEAGGRWGRRLLCTEGGRARPSSCVCGLGASSGDRRPAAGEAVGETRVQLETLGGDTPPGQPRRRGRARQGGHGRGDCGRTARRGWWAGVGERRGELAGGATSTRVRESSRGPS